MNKYIKGKNIIYATKKAYDVIYKDKGYKPFDEKNIKITEESEQEEKQKNK